jgi:hypothetical protein
VDYSSDRYHGIIVPVATRKHSSDKHNAPFGRLGRGFDQEGTGSYIRERSGIAHQNAAEGGKEVVNPGTHPWRHGPL